uniref:Putative secreted protein n=1 Tax=Ixodes ricinus TaxID=34613 RepID=A0A0K8R2P2_IXORI
MHECFKTNVLFYRSKRNSLQCKIRCGERRGFSRMWYTVSALDGMSCGEGRVSNQCDQCLRPTTKRYELEFCYVPLTGNSFRHQRVIQGSLVSAKNKEGEFYIKEKKNNYKRR